MWSEIIKAINSQLKGDFTLKNYRSVGGGCINQTYQLIGENHDYFVKLNTVSSLEMFISEALSLKEIIQTKTILAPQPICYGTVENYSYLVLEYLPLGKGNNSSWIKMGQQLALLHQFQGESYFGWHRNNTIGATPQINDWCDNWADFFAEKRIGYQLQQANRRGANFPACDRTIAKVRDYLQSRNPSPSLVHGDLWSGNASFTSEGIPVIFDPALYYGDREVDIAMTELFGGFPPDFYRGYNQQYPLDSGYAQRKEIYNLYHILNHFNLFGGSYLSQAKSILHKLL